MRLSRVPAVVCLSAVAAMSDPTFATQMVYIGFVTTDVQLGHQKWRDADVTLRFVGDTNDIQHFDVTSNTFLAGCGAADQFCGLVKGVASVTIVKGERVVHRTFRPGQIVVGFDYENIGIGFGSFVGPNGFEPAYPFGLDGGTTIALTTLPSPDATTSQSGKVYSCIGFGPDQYSCADPRQSPLMTTDDEPFFIFMPYYNQVSPGVLDSHFDFGSLSVGTFKMAPAAR